MTKRKLYRVTENEETVFEGPMESCCKLLGIGKTSFWNHLTKQHNKNYKIKDITNSLQYEFYKKGEFVARGTKKGIMNRFKIEYSHFHKVLSDTLKREKEGVPHGKRMTIRMCDERMNNKPKFYDEDDVKVTIDSGLGYMGDTKDVLHVNIKLKDLPKRGV